jgi:carbon monoxide dehydrogenase subunit G
LIELNGERHVSHAKDKVLAFLSDPNLFSSCLGNTEDLRVEQNGDFKAKFKIAVPKKFGVSYLENVTATMGFMLSKGPDSVQWEGSGRAVGVKLTIVLRLDARDEDGGTRLSWHASLNAAMVERMLGDQNLKEIASGLAAQILDCVSAEIGS